LVPLILAELFASFHWLCPLLIPGRKKVNSTFPAQNPDIQLLKSSIIASPGPWKTAQKRLDPGALFMDKLLRFQSSK